MPYKDDEEKAARRQAEAVRAYWRAKGYEIEAKAVYAGHKTLFGRSEKDRFWAVRTNLVNGLPVGFK